MMKKDEKQLRNSSAERFVNFTSGAIRVDVERYLKSSEGKKALERLDQLSTKQFQKKVSAR